MSLEQLFPVPGFEKFPAFLLAPGLDLSLSPFPFPELAFLLRGPFLLQSLSFSLVGLATFPENKNKEKWLK